MTTIIKGTLEIDHERGVVYFHAATHEIKTNDKPDGCCPTPLRIQGLGQIQRPFKDHQIDVGIFPIRLTRLNVSDKNLEERQVCEVMISK